VCNSEQSSLTDAPAAQRFSLITYFPYYEILMCLEPSPPGRQTNHVQLPIRRHVGATFLGLLGFVDKN